MNITINGDVFVTQYGTFTDDTDNTECDTEQDCDFYDDDTEFESFDEDECDDDFCCECCGCELGEDYILDVSANVNREIDELVNDFADVISEIGGLDKEFVECLLNDFLSDFVDI